MSRLAIGLVAVVALAVVAAGAVLGQAGREEPTAAVLPSAVSVGPRGLAAAFELLRQRGTTVVRRGPKDEAVPEAAVVLLVAPGASLSRQEVASLLAEADRGATLLVTLGRAAQPELLQALGLTLAAGNAPRVAHGLAPHRLVGDLALPAGSASLRILSPGPLPVSGGPGWTSAVSLPRERGEVLVLSGPEALENAHLLEGDSLSLAVRLGTLGTVVFDERFLLPSRIGPPPSRRALALLAGQILLAGLTFVLARGLRLGAVRPPPHPGAGRTARDYLASLAELYRRAGDEQELAADLWRAFRKRLERRWAIPARLSDAEAARRIASRNPEAALAVRRGGAARTGRGSGVLLALTRAAADAETALAGHQAGRGTSSAPRRPKALPSGD
ncbi:MAG TPA: DUF4350 domain-containing protein [Anaeromyxobacter sp.]|nr:DUF4350 domain-containing protein [Anaeromyxobacter sp.]